MNQNALSSDNHQGESRYRGHAIVSRWQTHSFDKATNKISDTWRDDYICLQPVIPMANGSVAVPQNKISV
jgi:hypothetical protein